MGYWLWMYDHEARLRDRMQADRAASRRSHRERFLAMVERALEYETDPATRRALEDQRRKVSRILGVNKPTADVVREQTRLRVQKHRARKRAAKAAEKARLGEPD
jgi:hypothetical protein